MRDLQKDLEEWITDHDIGARWKWFYMTGEYIERAIKAEAEVERLQKVYAITNESWKKQVEENAQLRKVADAARALVPSEMYQYTRHLFDLKHTLDEYDNASMLGNSYIDTSAAPLGVEVPDYEDDGDLEASPYIIKPDPLIAQLGVAIDIIHAERKARTLALIAPIAANADALAMIRDLFDKGLL